VAYLTRALRHDAGVVISASHNPFDDNGIKFFGRDGGKLADAVESTIEDQIEHQIAHGLPCVDSRSFGRARRLEDSAGRYIEFCKSTFPADLDLRGMRLVVDCSHGAAYVTAPAVFHELGAQVHVIGASPDGFNINEGVGATHPELLRRTVLETKADLGLALDGDADRLIVVDNEGRMYNGDELLYVLAMSQHKSRAVEGVVGTLMTNLAVENAFRQAGIGFVRAKVGDRYVLEEMQARGWLFGGEGSGHLLCLEKHSTGDGTISALQVLAAMRRSGLRLADLLDGVSLYPQTLINVRVSKGFDWKEQASVVKAAVEVELGLGSTGRLLIRPSGTEPVVRVMVEAQDATLAKRAAEQVAQAMTAAAA
jgi:phosphoglucosamine mutase